MIRATFIVLILLFASVTHAAPITYTFLSFQGWGNRGIESQTQNTNVVTKDVVVGTITTDGAMGVLALSDITAWSFSNGLGGTSATSGEAFTSGNGIVATATTLSLLTTGQLLLEDRHTIGPNPLIDSNLNFNARNGGIRWNETWSEIPGLGGSVGNISGTYTYPSLVIAAVGGGIPPGIPEPSSLVLLGLGLLSCAVARWRSPQMSGAARRAAGPVQHIE